MAKLGIYLKKDDFKKDTKDLLSYVCANFFGNTSPIVDMVVKFVPNARVGTANKVNMYYTGKENKDFIAKVSTCDSKEPLLINIVKLYNKPSCLSFDAFGRVISGTISKKNQVKVLGEGYTLDDEEDMTVKSVTGLFIHQGRYKVEIDNVKAGNWVLIEGIDQSINKVNFLHKILILRALQSLLPIHRSKSRFSDPLDSIQLPMLRLQSSL